MTVKKSTRATALPSGASRKKRATGTAENSNSRVLQLKGRLGIHEVNELKTKLSGFLDAKRNLILDASKVEKIDTSTLQVLAAFYRSATAKGIEIKWRNPNIRLLHAAELLGISGPLGLRSVNSENTD